MDWKAVLQSPFFTVAMPIVITLIVGIIQQNKRFDDLHQRMGDLNKRIDDLRADMNRQFAAVDRQFDAVNNRLDRIESKLEGHSERKAKLEGPALVRQG
jgi:tetrahydromethanopterin S-methyltransferase subunit G